MSVFLVIETGDLFLGLGGIVFGLCGIVFGLCGLVFVVMLRSKKKQSTSNIDSELKKGS
jgi:hypothetical protein